MKCIKSFRSSEYFLDDDLLLFELGGKRECLVGYLGMQDYGFEDDIVNILGHIVSTAEEDDAVLGKEVVT